jgi:hypothetical protein
VANARTAIEDAEDRAQAIRDEIQQAPPVTDVAALAAAIGAVRERGDPAGRAATLEAEAREAGKSIGELLAAMRPRVADVGGLAAMEVPPKASLEAHRDASRGLAQKRQGCRDRLQNAERELLRITNAYQGLVSDEQAIPAESGGFGHIARLAGPSSAASTSTEFPLRTTKSSPSDRINPSRTCISRRSRPRMMRRTCVWKRRPSLRN